MMKTRYLHCDDLSLLAINTMHKKGHTSTAFSYVIHAARCQLQTVKTVKAIQKRKLTFAN